MSTNRLTVSLSVDSFGGDGSSASGSLTIASVLEFEARDLGYSAKHDKACILLQTIKTV